MRALIRHPAFACRTITRIEAEAARHDDGILIHHVVHGDIGALSLPPAAPSVRTHELWKHTCVEAFIRASGSPRYIELNIAPSTQWATYAFDDNRAGRRDYEASPRITIDVLRDHFDVRALLPLPESLRRAPLQIALTAVIEEMNGDRSYWALAHPPGNPDFHHPAGFALELPEHT